MLRTVLFILMLMGFAITVYSQADQQAQTGDKEPTKRFLYQWSDGKGIVHIADGLDKVPKAYRDKAIKLEQLNQEDVGQGQTQQTVYPSGTASEAEERSLQIMWQQRMRDAKQRFVNAEKRYQDLDQRRNELLQSWGSPASGRLAERREAEKIEQEMKNVQREMDKAQNDIDVVIPEEARKADIPPGWLRE